MVIVESLNYSLICIAIYSFIWNQQVYLNTTFATFSSPTEISLFFDFFCMQANKHSHLTPFRLYSSRALNTAISLVDLKAELFWPICCCKFVLQTKFKGWTASLFYSVIDLPEKWIALRKINLGFVKTFWKW